MELSAFNRQADETSRTVELFKHVAETEPEAAHLLYNLAEPYLIQNECYSVCAPFLETSQRLAMAADIYRFESELEDAERDSFSPIPKLARFQYVSEAATLVALLVRNDRLADAKAACDIALETIDDARFRKALDKAMKGKFPASRPE
ncbi:hypothetical protein LOC68_26320 [Blastopirellula sp. JC732]|uniref:Uncharacterized protein n=1 Tax=Blastopirellula sediminis TaxID=2894196 RepID=A0A9X1MS91_9BACT|nr:hypothetical protein [Blastopirellula sediminis]MCC9604775.1 hypothetical protein [Blastopirellula sediminis]MCC9631926.1 hypothetical protein [Blastopirellula sediminis]